MSKSKDAFGQSLQDFNRLIEIHGHIGGTGKGRRYQLEVLNKSAVVLICACWESYCEDLLFEQLTRLTNQRVEVSKVPTALQAVLGRRVRKDPDDRAPWRLAGVNWRTELLALIAELKKEQNLMNTPKSPQINELFDKYLGIGKMSSSWRWPGITAARAGKKLNEFVTLRGSIAHRGQAAKSVTKSQAEDFAGHVERLVEKTDEAVLKYMRPIVPRARRRRRRRRKR